MPWGSWGLSSAQNHSGGVCSRTEPPAVLLGGFNIDFQQASPKHFLPTGAHLVCVKLPRAGIVPCSHPAPWSPSGPSRSLGSLPTLTSVGFQDSVNASFWHSRLWSFPCLEFVFLFPRAKLKIFYCIKALGRSWSDPRALPESQDDFSGSEIIPWSTQPSPEAIPQGTREMRALCSWEILRCSSLILALLLIAKYPFFPPKPSH